MAEYAAVPHTEDDEHLPRRKRRFSPFSLFSRDQLAEFSSAPVAIAAGVLLTAVSIWVLYAIFSGILAHRQVPLGEEINSLVPECTYHHLISLSPNINLKVLAHIFFSSPKSPTSLVERLFVWTRCRHLHAHQERPRAGARKLGRVDTR